MNPEQELHLIEARLHSIRSSHPPLPTQISLSELHSHLADHHTCRWNALLDLETRLMRLGLKLEKYQNINTERAEAEKAQQSAERERAHREDAAKWEVMRERLIMMRAEGEREDFQDHQQRGDSGLDMDEFVWQGSDDEMGEEDFEGDELHQGVGYGTGSDERESDGLEEGAGFDDEDGLGADMSEDGGLDRDAMAQVIGLPAKLEENETRPDEMGETAMYYELRQG